MAGNLSPPTSCGITAARYRESAERRRGYFFVCYPTHTRRAPWNYAPRHTHAVSACLLWSPPAPSTCADTAGSPVKHTLTNTRPHPSLRNINPTTNYMAATPTGSYPPNIPTTATLLFPKILMQGPPGDGSNGFRFCNNFYTLFSRLG